MFFRKYFSDSKVNSHHDLFLGTKMKYPRMKDSYCQMKRTVFPRRTNNEGRGEEGRGGEGTERKRESENKERVVSPQKCHHLLLSNILSISSIVF